MIGEMRHVSSLPLSLTATYPEPAFSMNSNDVAWNNKTLRQLIESVVDYRDSIHSATISPGSACLRGDQSLRNPTSATAADRARICLSVLATTITTILIDGQVHTRARTVRNGCQYG